MNFTTSTARSSSYTAQKPNAAHLRLAALEREGKCKAVVTQNIDGLYQAAAVRSCMSCTALPCATTARCGKFFPVSFIEGCGGVGDGVPRCDECGGIVKPDVVLYEEGLDEQTMENAVNAIRKADTLIVGGTSLAVYPAAGLLRYFRVTTLLSSTNSPPRRTPWPICLSTSQSGRTLDPNDNVEA